MLFQRLVRQQASLAANEFVHLAAFEELVVDPDWLQHPESSDALDIHVELLSIAITRVDDLDLVDGDLFVTAIANW